MKQGSSGGVFQDDLSEELSQGDIVDRCPFGVVPRIRVTRIFGGDEAKPDARSITYEFPLGDIKRPPSPALFARSRPYETILFEARLGPCVVLSDDCIALAKTANQRLSFKDQRAKAQPCHVAPLMPWPEPTQVVKMGEGVSVPLADLIADGRVKRYLEVPAFEATDGRKVARSYVDLRQITSVKPEVLEGCSRMASMTDFGRALLWAKVFTFFSGVEVPAEGVRCPSCGKSHPLAEVLGVGAETTPTRPMDAQPGSLSPDDGIEG